MTDSDLVRRASGERLSAFLCSALHGVDPSAYDPESRWFIGPGWSSRVERYASDPALTPSLIEAMGERGWMIGTDFLLAEDRAFNGHAHYAEAVSLYTGAGEIRMRRKDAQVTAPTMPLAVARAIALALLPDAAPEARALLTPEASGDSTPTA